MEVECETQFRGVSRSAFFTRVAAQSPAVCAGITIRMFCSVVCSQKLCFVGQVQLEQSEQTPDSAIKSAREEIVTRKEGNSRNRG